MRANNSLQARGNKPKFSVAIQTPMYQKLVNDTLGDPERARRFVAAISSAVAVNPALQACDAGTVLTAALLGESLNLSPSPQLGQYYLVPYNDKRRGPIAQFQLGYKGYIQLAIRSGQYRSLNVVPVLQGEFALESPLFEQYTYDPITDYATRKNTPVVGYVSAFELVNGFRKVLYWSREEMIDHADRYSPAFHADAVDSQDPRRSRVSFEDFQAGNYPKDDEWKYSSFWYKDFDGMACKTMLRQLISKWGIMSIDLQKAFAGDEAAVKPDLTPDYLETPEEAQDAPESPAPEPGEVITGQGLEQPPDLPDDLFQENADGQRSLS